MSTQKDRSNDFVNGTLTDLFNNIQEYLVKAKECNPNLIPPEMTGIMCLKPFVSYLTASRRQMVGGHLSSCLNLVNPTSTNIYTGYEFQFARTAYQLAAPCDMKIAFITYKAASTIVIFYDYDNHQYRSMEIPTYIITGDRFGCLLNINNDILYPNSSIRKGTIIAITKSVGPEGDWRHGVELNTLAISNTATIQDGICITTTARKALTTYGIGRRRVKITKDNIPLNVHGSGDVYQVLPNIGDKIGDDRIIAVTRSVDPLLAPLLISPRMLRKESIDTISDMPVYIGQGEYDAEVIDIKVFYQQPDGAPTTPVGMCNQLDMYRMQDAQSAEDTIRFHEKEVARNNIAFDGPYQITIRNAIRELGNYTDTELDRKNLRRYMKLAPLISNGETIGEYEVEVVYKYRTTPNYGDKITNTDGTKGVITSIIRDEDAYRDSAGNVAHVLLANLSIGRRTNVSALMYPGLNVYSRELAIELRETIKTNPEQAYLRLVKFYEIVSPEMAAIELKRVTEGKIGWLDSLKEAIYNGISPDPINPDRTLIPIFYPSNNVRDFTEIVRLLEINKFPKLRSKITYRNSEGKTIETASVSSIGSTYIIVLDKIASHVYSAVSTAKLQHHGMPAKETRAVRGAYPCSRQANRTEGESELRPKVAVTDGMSGRFKQFFLDLGMVDEANNTQLTHGPIAELVDRANNPAVMAHISRRILDSDNPLAIPYIVDRAKIPRGGSRALNMIEHIIGCAGVEFVK